MQVLQAFGKIDEQKARDPLLHGFTHACASHVKQRLFRQLPVQVLVHPLHRLASLRLRDAHSDLAHVGPVDLQPREGLILVVALKPGVCLHDVGVVQLAPDRLSLVEELPRWVIHVEAEHDVVQLLVRIGPVLDGVAHVGMPVDE